MKYHHSFKVQAPLSAVAHFHSQAASMGAITPPPIIVQLHSAPTSLGEGDIMDFTLWLGSIPIHWVAQIEQVGFNGFTDRQLAGPFARWVHRHRFMPVDDSTTEVIDEVEAILRPHPWWGVVGLGMWATMPLLFAYRGWKTRRWLENKKYDLDQSSIPA
ncbi:MAG: hypothetical protein U0401_15270 [Anaerolineae bacterium]